MNIQRPTEVLETPALPPAKKRRLEKYTAAVIELAEALQSPAFSEDQKLEMMKRFGLRAYTKAEAHLGDIVRPLNTIPPEILQQVFPWLHQELHTLRLVDSRFRENVDSYCAHCFVDFSSTLGQAVQTRLYTLGISSFKTWKQSLLQRHEDFIEVHSPLPKYERLKRADFDLTLCRDLEQEMHATVLKRSKIELELLPRRASFNQVSFVTISSNFALTRPGVIEVGSSVLEIPILPPFGENTSRLIIQAKHIHYIQPEAFKNLSEIDTLELHDLRAYALAPGALSSMENLSTLILRGMDLSTLDLVRLQECQNLKHVHLQGCTNSEALVSTFSDTEVEVIHEERAISPPPPPFLLALPLP